MLNSTRLFLLLISTTVCLANQIDDENPNSPVFYCFVDPPVKTRLPPNLLENITACTHLVYGRIPIDKDTGFPEYSITDVSSGYDIDNIRTFLRMKNQHPTAKFLMGVQRSRPFEDSLTAIRVAEGLRKQAKAKSFDGLFVTFNGIHLEYQSSTAFLENLSKDLKLSLTFGVSARRVFAFEAVRRLQEINQFVEHVYLDMGELPSNEDPRQITQINPLFSNGSIPFEETIQGAVEELSKEGILPTRLVIGLTAGGWKFEIKNSQDPLRVSHGDFAKENGNRISYQEACRARGAVVYDWQVMNEVTVYRQTWISVNLPVMKAMGEKMKWILAQKFAGFGISSALSDDPEGQCGTDPLPAHRLATQLFSNTLTANAPKCTRLCYLDPDDVDDTFPIDNLSADYCSHLVVRYFDLDLQRNVVVAENAEQLVEKIDGWRGKILDVAPKLLLSLGSKQTTGVWQFILGNDFRRKELAEELVKLVNSTTADGLEISWTLESMVSEFDKKNLKALIDDVKVADVRGTVEIAVAASVDSSYADFYDYEHLNKTANLIILHSHRLHSPSTPYTGHFSPIRATSTMKNANMTWQAILGHWTARKVARSKLVLSLSASTLSMQSLADQRSASSRQNPFGQPAFVSVLRSKKADIHSQHEICESLKSGNSEESWVDMADVPYLRRYDQMVAYENARSAHIKAVWSSMEGVGGLAVHHIQHDDPAAVCDNKTAFPILAALRRAQTCHGCVKHHDFKKCSGGGEFVVSCRFELAKSVPLFKTDILPYERCTEVVVDRARLTLGGNVTFHDSHHEMVVRNLTSMRSKMLKCGMVLEISCGDSERHLNSILGDNMTSAIENVMKTMEKHKFSGIQLDCEKAIRRGNHIYFNTFLRKLALKFEKSKAANGCAKTLAVRFSHFTRTPANYYSVSLLNKLSHISLKMSDKNQVDLPFFQNQTDPKFPSAERFLRLWQNFGLKPAKIVLEVSSLGEKLRENGDKLRITQGETCIAVGNRAKFEPDYETLTSSVAHENGTISLPMVDDLRYKISYIKREQLGGISLNSVNGDDFTGICGRGSFPLLKSVYANQKCR
uniref:Glyco_18 domain-containing protein n=1 Tax=Caenorhabditis japonica TaxID=281687 RepID=A0A8R1E0Q8_CAEJA